MGSLTAHESTAALCKASVGKISLFLSLKIVHRAQKAGRNPGCTAVSVSCPHRGHWSTASATGPKPSRQGGSPSAGPRDHPSLLLSHIPAGHWQRLPQRGLPASTQQETVSRRGDTQDTRPAVPPQLLHRRHWRCL